MATPQVIIKGRVEREEFKTPFRHCTEYILDQIGVPYCVNSAISEEPVNFVLFFQSYPHEFPRSDLGQLRKKNPFAPFFFVLGACCEGMLRTTGTLDSPFFCYAHAWNGGEAEQIRLFLTDQPSLFSLPLTAEQDEIALWWTDGGKSNVPSPPLGTTKNSLILTHFGPFGNDSEMNRLLADEQNRLGNVPIFPGQTLPDAFSGKIVADADNSPRQKILESIQRLRHQFADNDFTVYVDSPRIDEKNDYFRAGVTRVLPKIR